MCDEERLILATGRYIGEGFDDARLDTLFLALPVSWKGTIVQYPGRLHRQRPEKKDVRIYDFVDRNVPMLARMFEKRMKGYRALGYVLKNPATTPSPWTFRYRTRFTMAWGEIAFGSVKKPPGNRLGLPTLRRERDHP